jgi:hypothetical protein
MRWSRTQRRPLEFVMNDDLRRFIDVVVIPALLERWRREQAQRKAA